MFYPNAELFKKGNGLDDSHSNKQILNNNRIMYIYIHCPMATEILCKKEQKHTHIQNLLKTNSSQKTKKMKK